MVSVSENFSRLEPGYKAELIAYAIFGSCLLFIVLLQIKAQADRQKLRKQLARQGRRFPKDSGDGVLSTRVRYTLVPILMFRLTTGIRLFSGSHVSQAVDWYCATVINYLIAGLGLLIAAEMSAQARQFAHISFSVSGSRAVVSVVATSIAILLMSAAFAVMYILDREWVIAVILGVFGLLLAFVIVFMWTQAIRIHQAVMFSKNQIEASCLANKVGPNQLPPSSSSSEQIDAPTSDVHLSVVRSQNSTSYQEKSFIRSKTDAITKGYVNSPIRRFFTFLIFATVVAIASEVIVVSISLRVASDTNKPFFRDEIPGGELYEQKFSGASVAQLIVMMLLLWQSWGGFVWPACPRFLLTPYIRGKQPVRASATNSTEKGSIDDEV